MDPLPAQPSADPATADMPTATEVREVDVAPTPPTSPLATVGAAPTIISPPATATADKATGAAKRKTMDEGKDDDEDDVEVIEVDKEGDKGIKKKPAVKEVAVTKLFIKDIFDDTEEGEDRWANNGLPKLVELKPIQPKLTSEVWKYFRQMKLPIFQKIDSRKPSKVLKLDFGKADRFRELTHVCILCLGEVKELENPHNTSWAKALFKMTKTGNAIKHLCKAHPTHPCVVALLKKKKAEEIAKGSLDAVGSNPRTEEVQIENAIYKQSASNMRTLQAKWLALNSVPHEITQSPEFLAMFRSYDQKFVPIARETFMEELDKMFLNMCNGIKKLVGANRLELGNGKWLTICHDMWNTINMDGALGSSLKLTTKEMQTYTIAAVLEKNNISHGAVDVAEVLQTIYNDRYDIDLKNEVASCASDTCKSAANVSGNLDAEQQCDCEMHVVSLCLGYGFGVKENTRSRQEAGENGQTKKVTTVVTPGGPFPEGARLVKASRQSVNFFDKSPQRKEKLDDVRKAMDLPIIALVNFPETRVGYIVTTLQSMMANHCLLSLAVHNGNNEEFEKVWSKLSKEDMASIQEMEAVTKLLFAYAVMDSQQSNAFNSSLLPWYRKAMIAATTKDTYEVMVLTRQPPATRLNNWPRTPRKVIDFTPAGKQCLHRLQEQVKLRLPPPSAAQCLSVLLDPATKKFATALLNENGLYVKTKELLKLKHRSTYKAFYAPPKAKGSDVVAEEDEQLDTPVEAVVDTGYTDDLLGMTCELAPEEAAESEETRTDKKADELFDEWMKHSVLFYKHVFDGSPPLPEAGDCTFHELVAKFDTMKYFRDVGTREWPTITILARIHFSKMDNSAFQERVFSTASNVQRKTQSKMSFSHLEKRTLLAQNKELIRDNVI